MTEKNGEGHTKEFWDKKSVSWIKNLENEKSQNEGESRFKYTDDFLIENGLYNKDSEILDIGCGPGTFSIRFAEIAKGVTGLDISSNMLSHAKQNMEKKGLKNYTFINSPWQDIVLKENNMEKAYDLVFASLCPPVNNEDNLLKMCLASRDWCFNSFFVKKQSSLKDSVYRHILGVPFDSGWGKESLGDVIKWLLKAGFYPNVTYYNTNFRQIWDAGEKAAVHFAGHLGPITNEAENIRKYKDEVLKYLQSIAVDNKIIDDTESKIAFLYWQVQ